MPTRKTTPSKSKKVSKKVVKKTGIKSSKNKTLSFLVGIITVTIIAIGILVVAQNKNYTNVLGTQTVQQSR